MVQRVLQIALGVGVLPIQLRISLKSGLCIQSFWRQGNYGYSRLIAKVCLGIVHARDVCHDSL